TPVAQRSRLLRALARLIERDQDRLARAESIDTGKPLSLAASVDIPRAAQNFEFFADAITQFASEAHPTDEVALNYTSRPPLGVTGSTRVGREIAAQTSQRFVKCSLEMGGKNPNVIFADADLDAAVDGAVRAAFQNQGQICLCGSRILVERAAYAAVRERLV